MKCPFCGSTNTQVKDSRDTIDETAIRRRRECPDCGGRFTTYERVQLPDLTVVKKNGERVPFDLQKHRRKSYGQTDKNQQGCLYPFCFRLQRL